MATVSIEDARGNPFLEVIDVITPDPLNPSRVSESIRLPSRQGNIVDVGVNWRGKPYAIKMFTILFIFSERYHRYLHYFLQTILY